ncbi:acyl-coenzyme A thioesterase 5-like isoform X3 [Nyctibius grandis]|uniref:acyl-coenzyme A thioesterase 5-like isoform X3 n=1 Tax=Nyctibius grandis TaxID=48427 RepID=UPI0035BBD3C8
MWRAVVVAAASAPARALCRAPPLPPPPPRRRAVSVAVSPTAGLADERLETRVAGLGPGQPVTLRAVAADERGCLFQSCAHYRADSRGELHLGTDASHGGDYTGVEPMGLFWSLAPAGMERPYQRLVPRSTDTPMKVEMLVHQGHSLPGALPGPVVAKAEVERWFTAPGVRRIRLKEGGVRGSLFLPPGDGPFPGVIDMYGDEGGLIEFRSSLLATHGFAALSLPYFDFEDLPKVMKEFNLEYFEEAARFLRRHPKVKGPGVGVIGTGKGAELGLSMITFLPEVVAAVSISGCSSNTVADLHYGEMTLPGLRFDMNKEEKNGQKASEAKEVKLYGQIPPVERMDESLSTLVNCEKLSLSTNCIERIANLNSLKNLRILSLGRNNIKNLNGLEAVADTLEELWISYNFIEKLRGIRVMKKLKVLYMSNNLVKDWAEFVRLAELPLLEDLVFVGNPLQEKYASDQKNNWIEEATKRVPKLKKLDGILVIKQEEDEEGAN